MNTFSRSLQRQRGIGFVGLICIFAVVGVVVLLGLKLVPAYLEFFSVKKVIGAMANAEEVRSGTVADIRKSFARRSVIDNIYALTEQDLEITKDGGETVVTAAWQQRVSLFTGYTLLIDFSVSTQDK